MRAIGLLIVFLSLAASAQAVCPPAPVGKPSDSVVQFVTSGTAGFGPTTAMDATREGAVVYDPAAKVLKVCNGSAWVEVAGGGTSSMVANWPDAILCVGGGSTVILHLVYAPHTDERYTYAEPWTNGATYYISYNSNGTFHAQTTRDYTNCKSSIAAIKADGRAFNFIGGGSMPSGAIMAFDLASCPAGWTEYTPARGRFLRGIDNGAGNDPGGTRAPGNVQADELRSHTHTATTDTAGAHTHTVIHGNFGTTGTGTSGAMMSSNSGGMGAGTSSAGAHAHTVTVNNTGGAETRPKNVAVLYCRKA